MNNRPTLVSFEKIAVLGIGLIGSSLALAIKEKKLTTDLSGFDLSPAIQKEARDLSLLPVADSLEAAVAQAELIIIATPPGAIPSIIQQISQLELGETIIMDVGSVKGVVVKAAESLPAHLHFIPAHPVAGTEQSGPSAGFAHLFEGRWSILTPLEKAETRYQAAVEKVEAFWQAVGAQVTKMSAQHHDLALAVTSHLPHLIAYTLVGAAHDVENVTQAEVVKYSAGGFRDFTRIAASDPVMWRDVFLNNKEAVIEVLGRFSEELALMQRAIRWDDAETLQKAFERSRGLRRAIIEAGQERPEANFGRDTKDLL
ncbi:MAG: prephenate/arogenate dehydrogenase family protein [bacterium]